MAGFQVITEATRMPQPSRVHESGAQSWHHIGVHAIAKAGAEIQCDPTAGAIFSGETQVIPVVDDAFLRRVAREDTPLGPCANREQMVAAVSHDLENPLATIEMAVCYPRFRSSRDCNSTPS